MTTAEYLVVERENHWCVMIDGFRRGPYLSRQIAIDSAIVSARTDFKGGRQARVSVQHGSEFITVYDSRSD